MSVHDGLKRGSATRLSQLEATNRMRPLDAREISYVERAAWGSKGQRYWSKGDIGRLKRYLARGKKPRQIAPLMGRTERAVWRMIYRLKLSVRAAECAIAANDTDQDNGRS